MAKQTSLDKRCSAPGASDPDPRPRGGAAASVPAHGARLRGSRREAGRAGPTREARVTWPASAPGGLRAPPGRSASRADGGRHMGASARPRPEPRPLTFVTALVAAPGPAAPAVPPSPGRAPTPAPLPAAPAAPLLPPAAPVAPAALAARLLRSFFFFLSLLAKKLSRLRSSVSAMALASATRMGGAGGGRGPRGSDLGVDAGSALGLLGAATPQPRGVAEASAAGQAAPPREPAGGGTVRLMDRAPLLAPEPAEAAAAAATPVQDPTRSAVGGEKERAARSSGVSARLAAARAAGRARAGPARRGEGWGGEGGGGGRAGLQERGSVRPAYYDPPTAVGARRGGRKGRRRRGWKRSQSGAMTKRLGDNPSH